MYVFKKNGPRLCTQQSLDVRLYLFLLGCWVCPWKPCLQVTAIPRMVSPNLYYPLLMPICFWTLPQDEIFFHKYTLNHGIWLEDNNDAFLYLPFPQKLPLLLQDTGNFYESWVWVVNLARGFNVIWRLYTKVSFPFCFMSNVIYLVVILLKLGGIFLLNLLLLLLLILENNITIVIEIDFQGPW